MSPEAETSESTQRAKAHSRGERASTTRANGETFQLPEPRNDKTKRWKAIYDTLTHKAVPPKTIHILPYSYKECKRVASRELRPRPADQRPTHQ